MLPGVYPGNKGAKGKELLRQQNGKIFSIKMKFQWTRTQNLNMVGPPSVSDFTSQNFNNLQLAVVKNH